MCPFCVRHFKFVGKKLRYFKHALKKTFVVTSSEHQHVALLHLRLPFLKEKASDELNYAQDVIEFLSHMGTQIICLLFYIKLQLTNFHSFSILWKLIWRLERVRLALLYLFLLSKNPMKRQKQCISLFLNTLQITYYPVCGAQPKDHWFLLKMYIFKNRSQIIQFRWTLYTLFSGS